MSTIDAPVHTVDLDIEGMTCASCARRVERHLDELDGVEAATVNLATERASVVLPARSTLTPDGLAQAVRDIGYGATPHHDPTADESSPGADRAPHASAGSRPGLRVAASAIATVPVVALAMTGNAEDGVGRWLVAALATVVALVVAWPIHRSALLGLRHRTLGMDTLVSLGVVAAWGWSAVVVAAGIAEDQYFEVAAVIVTFVLLGRLLEHRARREAGAAVRALLAIGPRTATVLDADGTERSIEASQIEVGQLLVVRPGEQVPTDGTVERGSSAVDMSLVTGESLPVDVVAGDEVIGGSGNVDGRLEVRATRVGADTALARIARLVETAQRGTAPVQRLADRVSAIFVPIVIGLSLATLAGWLLLGGSTGEAIAAAVAVLIVACPCALGLATPTALLAGTGRGAQLGLLIKGPEVLERTRRIDTMLLDKTGTLTTGDLRLVHVTPGPGETTAEVLERACAVERGSEHPIARAILAGAVERGMAPSEPASDTRIEAGTGVTGTVDGTAVWVRRPTAVEQRGDRLASELRSAIDAAEAGGRTAVLVGWEGAARGALVVADTIRDESAEAVRSLRELGIRPVLLTGDNHRAAAAVAEQVGIGLDDVVADARPEDKDAEVARRQSAGEVVAMLGDGVNDAPALARADLGLAVGSGSDAALESGDIALVTSDPRAAAAAVRLSRRTLGTIRGNLFWAFVYNVAALPLAAAGVLEPMIASAAMAFSSIFVVLNSLRLRRFEWRG